MATACLPSGMVKLVGAAGAVLMATVPAWIVVEVVAVADLSFPPPEPMNDTSTTPAPITKIARPRINICEDRRIAMETPFPNWRPERAERPLNLLSAGFAASRIARPGHCLRGLGLVRGTRGVLSFPGTPAPPRNS